MESQVKILSRRTQLWSLGHDLSPRLMMCTNSTPEGVRRLQIISAVVIWLISLLPPQALDGVIEARMKTVAAGRGLDARRRSTGVWTIGGRSPTSQVIGAITD